MNNRKRIIVKREQVNKNIPIWDRLNKWNSSLIALIPLLGYLVSFLYIKGYLEYFDIPIEFITFEPTDLITISILALLIAFSVILIGLTIHRIRKKYMKDSNPFTALIMVLYLLSAGSHLMITKRNSIEFYITLPMYISIALVFLFSIYAGFDILSPSLEEIAKYYPKSPLSSIFSVLHEIRLVRIIIIFFIVRSLNSIATLQGGISAQNRVIFPVLKSSSECVILYLKSDRAICAPFNRANKEVENSYQLIYFQEEPNIVIEMEKIGPLHLKPTPTRTPKPTLTSTITNTPIPTQTATPVPAATQ